MLPTGSQVLTPAQELDLLAGNMYTNVRSTTYPNGELRAQLTLSPGGRNSSFLNPLPRTTGTPAPGDKTGGTSCNPCARPVKTCDSKVDVGNR